MLGCQEYEKLVETMERRFGNNHMQEVYRNELKSRIQKQGETLQELEADVRRLAYLAHSEYPSEVIENTVTNAFETILDRSKLQNWRRSQKSGKLEAADVRGRDQRLKNAPIITTRNNRKRVIIWS